MRALFSALAAVVICVIAVPQNTLACHKGTPHGSEVSCDDGSAPTSRIVFVTSDHYDGALDPDPNNCGDGVAGGDCICQYHANEAGLTGTFFAWLSDSTSSPATDFVKSAVPYVRLDGVMVASSWDDLTDGTILAPIEVNELGGRPNVDPSLGGLTIKVVWTGTDFDGTSSLQATRNCLNWTTAQGDLNQLGGVGGLTEQIGIRWTVFGSDGGSRRCESGPHHLYCFEQ